MKTIKIEVPDDVADRIEAASESERMALADRFAALVNGREQGTDLETVFDEIVQWQARHGVRQSDFDSLFKELSEED